MNKGRSTALAQMVIHLTNITPLEDDVNTVSGAYVQCSRSTANCLGYLDVGTSWL
jgi:hypothetical protein